MRWCKWSSRWKQTLLSHLLVVDFNFTLIQVQLWPRFCVSSEAKYPIAIWICYNELEEGEYRFWWKWERDKEDKNKWQVLDCILCNKEWYSADAWVVSKKDNLFYNCNFAFITTTIDIRSLRGMDIEKVVGSGTFGVVFKATIKDTGERVALKKFKLEIDPQGQGFPMQVHLLTILTICFI